jgi:hypothetical protein
VKRALILTTFAAIVALSTGCASQYTSIRKNDDGTYVITRVKSGFIRMYGSTYLCTAQGEGLSCKEIDSL